VRNKYFIKFKSAQATIFIIIAIILIAGIISFLVLRESPSTDEIPSSLEPAYNNFLYCLEEETKIGIDILESQAGYIELPEFEKGSSHMPFSSQLNFLGTPIPYWYYVSGNNIQREQIPTEREMEIQLENFIEEKIYDCEFEEYYEQGFKILLEESKANVNIKRDQVEVNLDMDMIIEKGEERALIDSSKVTIKSELGNLFDSARKVYDKEQKELFLENYGVDILRLYAPVDGVELTCSPLMWNADEIFDELEEAIQYNTLALRTKGGDYSLKNEENKYFVLDIDENVRFFNFRNWTNSFEVNPTEGGPIMIAEPIGNQPGLGILGFCYVPYHFVYDIKYPVLIQIYSEKTSEIFQFPVGVVIQGNQPRNSLDFTASEFETIELCKHKNTGVTVNTYDVNLNSIESDVSYECLGATCEIGKTDLGSLTALFPQCVNGYILVNSEGFVPAKYLYSTVSGGEVDIILDRLYNLSVNLRIDNKNSNERAIISFISDRNSNTIVYPEQRNIELSEGQYEIKVYIYENSSIKLEETVYEKCIETPKSGLGGMFGLTEEKCFEMKIPEQIISNALTGGGKQNYYILESELKNSDIIEINSESLPKPQKIEDLHNNYLLFENKNLDIEFK
jgi:hypothetical protein